MAERNTRTSESLRSSFILSPNYFRPLVLLSFIAENSVAGIDARLFHLTNLLLHALNSFLVVLLAQKLWPEPAPAEEGSRSWTAVLAGLLYGLHPALLEGVAFISSRFDLLLTSALLLARWADGALRTRSRRALAVGGSFFLAALAKERAATFFLGRISRCCAAPCSSRSGTGRAPSSCCGRRWPRAPRIRGS